MGFSDFKVLRFYKFVVIVVLCNHLKSEDVIA